MLAPIGWTSAPISRNRLRPRNAILGQFSVADKRGAPRPEPSRCSCPAVLSLALRRPGRGGLRPARLQRPRRPAPGRDPAPRGRGAHRRRARRRGLAAGRAPDGLLGLRAGGRRAERRADRGARLLLSDRDPLQRARAGGARNRAGDARQPRPPRHRGPGPHLPVHVQRRPPGALLRGEPAGRAGGRRAGRGHRHARRRLRGPRDRTRGARPVARLRVRLEGPADRGGLRGRGAHPFQDPALPLVGAPVVGPARHAHAAVERRTRTPGRRRAARPPPSSRRAARSTA